MRCGRKLEVEIGHDTSLVFRSAAGKLGALRNFNAVSGSCDFGGASGVSGFGLRLSDRLEQPALRHSGIFPNPFLRHRRTFPEFCIASGRRTEHLQLRILWAVQSDSTALLLLSPCDDGGLSASGQHFEHMAQHHALLCLDKKMASGKDVLFPVISVFDSSACHFSRASPCNVCQLFPISFLGTAGNSSGIVQRQKPLSHSRSCVHFAVQFFL